MGHILQSGGVFRPISNSAVLREDLPVGVYTFESSPDGYYLSLREPFRDLPPIYGDHPRWAKRILETFGRKDSNMGVLLSGEKGGGKSLLGKLVANEAASQGMATILIEDSHSPKAIGELIAALDSPALIFIDEFEKTYSHPDGNQTDFLTLLDGTSGSRHLFLLTVNDPRGVNRHMLNRPGRIHYRIDFEGLDESFIRSYCADRLEYPAELEPILWIANCFDHFNFDQLKSLVDEINAYGEPALEAVKLLNISPELKNRSFEISIVDSNGVKQNSHMRWEGNVLTAEAFYFETWAPQGDRSWPVELSMTREDAIRFDAAADIYIFSKDGYTVTLNGMAPRRKQLKWWDAITQNPAQSRS